MKLITRDSDYAIRALCFIARNKNKRVSVTSLIQELEIPRPFLRKILQILTINNILTSFKGKGGGFELAKKPEAVFIKTIMEIFQGTFKLSECILRNKLCPEIKICELRKKLDEIEADVAKKLNRITIQTLIEKT